MVQPTNGQLIGQNGIGNLQDANGDTIQFEKDKDGNYKPVELFTPLGYDEKGKITGQVKYIYSITPKGDWFEVGVAKQKVFTKEQEEKAKESGVIVAGQEGAQGPIPEKDIKKAEKESDKDHDKEVKKQKDIEKDLKK